MSQYRSEFILNEKYAFSQNSCLVMSEVDIQDTQGNKFSLSTLKSYTLCVTLKTVLHSVRLTRVKYFVFVFMSPGLGGRRKGCGIERRLAEISLAHQVEEQLPHRCRSGEQRLRVRVLEYVERQ